MIILLFKFERQRRCHNPVCYKIKHTFFFFSKSGKSGFYQYRFRYNRDQNIEPMNSKPTEIQITDRFNCNRKFQRLNCSEVTTIIFNRNNISHLNDKKKKKTIILSVLPV